MLHIAICDDESQHRSDLRCILETYLRSRGLAARIWEFESGAALLSSVSDQQDYDLYLLDVVMPGLNGIQVGLQLRQTNHTGILLYLTNSPDYAVDSYRTKSMQIGCDCYPYEAFSTGLGSTTYDDGWRDRYGCGYDVVELAEGKYKGQRCTKEIFDEVRRDFPDCKTICYVMVQEEVDLAFRHPGVMLGSDGTLSEGQGHPRAAGAFPRLIARYVKNGTISMYEAINKMTAMPAAQLGLPHKGRLNVGADADVVVFDPQLLEDCATFTDPLLPPKGMDYVIVGGKIAAERGKIVCRNAGKAVRRYQVGKF